MGCRHLEESYELYLLGATTGEDSTEVWEHVVGGCPYCLERLAEATQVVYLLSQTARPVRPGFKQKSLLLRRLGRK